MQFPGLRALGRAEPEIRRSLRAGQADDEGVADREAQRLADPDRRESTQVKRERRLDVSRLDTQVIDH
jgi:hypothetical protein